MDKHSNKQIIELRTPDDGKIVNRLKQYQKLGLKIAYYRKRKGLTQMELAECINISRTYISNIEAPKTCVNPTLDVILNIADALDIPVSKLFDETL